MAAQDYGRPAIPEMPRYYRGHRAAASQGGKRSEFAVRCHPAAMSLATAARRGAEDRGADADVGRAEADRGLEIGAHPHAQHSETVALRDLAQQREMQGRLLVLGRDAHQPAIGNPSRSRQSRMKSSAAAGKTPAFCASSPVLTSI